MTLIRHHRITALIHWTHAGLVFILLALGWIMLTLPKGAPKAQLMALHKSLGICALALILLRLGWRARHRFAPQRDGKVEVLTETRQGLLVLLLFLTPCFGFLGTVFGKYPLRFFALEISKPFASSEFLYRLFTSLHAAAVWVLAGLVILHLIGAVHHLVSRNGLAGRLPPFRSRPPTLPAQVPTDAAPD